MKTLIKIIALSTLFFTASVMAGPAGHGHSHEPTMVSQATATKNAELIVDSLIKKHKLDKSWTSIQASSTEKRHLNNVDEWVVTFFNKDIVDINKQKLYVFLTLSGEYIAANYTGN